MRAFLELLEARASVRFGRVFKPHSMSRRTEFRCPLGKRRDPEQDPLQRRPRCIPSRKAVGGQGELVRQKRHVHLTWLSGKGRAQDRRRKRWRSMREPLLKARGEAEFMGDVFALLENASPKSLGERAFWERIDAAPADKYIASGVVDWGGHQRGEGKRFGKMIRGAMSGRQRGRKTYYALLANAPLDTRQREEVEGLTLAQQSLVAQALAAGFDGEVALTVAYTRGLDPISRSEAYALIAGG